MRRWLFPPTLSAEIVGATRRDHLAALLSCCAVAAAPLFIGISHQFFVEPLQLVAVAWILRIALRAGSAAPRDTLWELLLACSLAMAAKATSPLYIAAPAVLALRAALRGRGRRHPPARLTWLKAILGGGMALLTIAWYARNLGPALEHLSGGAQLVAELHGEGSDLVGSAVFWLAELQRSLCTPLVGVLAILAIPLAGLGRAKRPPLPESAHTALLIGSALHILLVLSLLAVHHNQEPRFLLPLLPHVALLLAWLAARARRRAVLGAVLALLLVQYCAVQAQALGWADWPPAVSHWVAPADRAGLQRQRLEEVLQRCCAEPDGAGGRDILVLAELPWLNVNSLSFAAASRWPDSCRFHWLGMHDPQLEQAASIMARTPHDLLVTARTTAEQAGPAQLRFDVLLEGLLPSIAGSQRYVEQQALQGSPQVRFFLRRTR